MQHDILWTPDESRVADHPMTAFAQRFARRCDTRFDTYDDLHAASVKRMDLFWSTVWDELAIVGDKGGTVLEGAPDMRDSRFFPDARLNFAENLLKRRGSGDAIVFRREDGLTDRISWDNLRLRTGALQSAMRAHGVTKGDRVAAMLPNAIDAVTLMLAATSIGAVWTSCSPDFGERGVVDRFGQTQPKLLFACDGYVYAGKSIELAERLLAVGRALPDTEIVVVPFLDDGEGCARAIGARTLIRFLEGHEPREPDFERLAFDHPLYILYSSGTTGAPKCILHRAGGVLLQHVKEHALHCGIREGDRTFYFTTLGWMMWNWLVSSLAVGATLMLFDGSPFHPSGRVLFDYAEAERTTFFGTSAKFIDAVRQSDLRPIETHDLSAVRAIASTGSPLSPDCFRFVYDGIHADVHLASVSGGTDICACFVSCVPWEPVRTGEIQGAALAMASDVWDDDGRPVVGEKGELVCAEPFPSLPLGFWNDEDGSRYHASYFARFPGVWCHGDFAEWVAREDGSRGGMIIHGRSDATLNPGGVRIGTAEIYNVVEGMNEVAEAVCVGQSWDSDTRVVLFVVLGEGAELDDELRSRIRQAIRTGASPRHVPARIVAVPDIPRTKSGKISELAVRDVVEGRNVKNVEALANPEALEHFRERAELRG